MRGTVQGLASPLPLAATLPSMLRSDPFATSVCDGLDEVLAPVLLTLDSYPAYLDADTAPDDVLSWLAQWVGVAGTRAAPMADDDAHRLRTLLATAQQLHLRRGTRLGIEHTIAAELGLDCEVVETGAGSWSSEAGGPLPDGNLEDDGPAILITVHDSPDRPVDVGQLEAVLESAVPAHVRRRINVRQPG